MSLYFTSTRSVSPIPISLPLTFKEYKKDPLKTQEKTIETVNTSYTQSTRKVDSCGLNRNDPIKYHNNTHSSPTKAKNNTQSSPMKENSKENNHDLTNKNKLLKTRPPSKVKTTN